MIPFPFQVGMTNPFFQSAGMVPECHTAVKTACNPRIMDSPPALSSPTLIIQMTGVFPPINFATASLTSSMEGAVLSVGGSSSSSVSAHLRCRLGAEFLQGSIGRVEVISIYMTLDILSETPGIPLLVSSQKSSSSK